ncbi:O-antigen ligase family protein [Acidisarcina polymorpha]|nr:O-antigen ligase family protein [Acidisarcina polymorpha]
MLTGAGVVALSILLAVVFPQYGIDHQLHEGAWQGLFTQKNVCAESTLFLLTPALTTTSMSRYGQVLRYGYISACLLIIVMSQSRTGWAMCLLYFAFVSTLRLLRRVARKDILKVAFVSFTVVGGVAIAIQEYPSVVLSLVSRAGNVSGRTQIWKAVTESILRHPIGGYGFDAFWSLFYGEASHIFAATGWVVTSAHNGFLNVTLELGIVGLVLVSGTFVAVFRHAAIAFAPGRSSYIEWCIGIVFLTLVYNLDERTLMATQYLPWILYILACVGLKKASRLVTNNTTFLAAEDETA